MTCLPDAPWIRDAELNGVPVADDEEYTCPVCGVVTPDYIYLSNHDVIGCSECIRRVDGWRWASYGSEGV